jgi:hypothetical protein
LATDSGLIFVNRQDAKTLLDSMGR